MSLDHLTHKWLNCPQDRVIALSCCEGAGTAKSPSSEFFKELGGYFSMNKM